jgi:hypothetical protein
VYSIHLSVDKEFRSDINRVLYRRLTRYGHEEVGTETNDAKPSHVCGVGVGFSNILLAGGSIAGAWVLERLSAVSFYTTIATAG